MNQTPKSPRNNAGARRLLILLGSLIAISPILLTPPLMDVRFWFSQYPAHMDYSITNIYNLWHQYLLPGRFVPLSDLSVYAYAFLGHKFMQYTQAPLNYFDGITKLVLIGILYYAIRNLFRDISKGSSGASSSILSNLYPIGLFIVWGLGANIFWDMNGVVAYPFMIYTPFIVSILFIVATLKNLRILANNNQGFNNVTIILIVLSTLWANFYYEIAYLTIP